MNELEELRALVREVIRDVLPKGLPVTETVNLWTDQDLAAFVNRLLDLDPDQVQELRSGRKRFRLAAHPPRLFRRSRPLPAVLARSMGLAWSMGPNGPGKRRPCAASSAAQ